MKTLQNNNLTRHLLDYFIHSEIIRSHQSQDPLSAHAEGFNALNISMSSRNSSEMSNKHKSE